MKIEKVSLVGGHGIEHCILDDDKFMIVTCYHPWHIEITKEGDIGFAAYCPKINTTFIGKMSP